jgi:enamine deaminase RidA (YjgF/YER057c/UK114 family)
MIRILSLAAALAVLPLTQAVAEENKTPSEAAIERAASAFEARMESFGARAEAINDDKSLTDGQREAKIATLWSEYQPEVAVFTAVVSQHAGQIASEALANIDVDALVHNALGSPEVQSALAGAGGMARNGAWAQNDPEQMVTYGLMAQYGVDQALDAIADDNDATEDAAEAADDAKVAEADAEAADAHAHANHTPHTHR